MVELVEIKRLVVIADTVLEKTLLEHFLKLGAKGYTCNYCAGKGRHETLEDPYNGRSRVYIELLAEESVATAIFDYVHRKQFGSYPVAAYMHTVEVCAQDHFY